MASLFVPAPHCNARLLDAGAGIGSLGVAFVEQAAAMGLRSLRVEAFEQDDSIHDSLVATLAQAATSWPCSFAVTGGDFIEEAVNRIQFKSTERFTHAILNPPYKKINGASTHRLLLRQAGIEAGNLYSAFVALALELMEPGGQLVAIIPRSFCNGPYYRPFRELLLNRAALRRLHLFDSRNTAFKDDRVLQENVIIHLERAGVQQEVVVSTSTDDRFEDLAVHRHAFERIVFPDDAERFIHVPKTAERGALEDLNEVRCSLVDVGVQVSTGPVVDFRLAPHLRAMPGSATAPLLYPGHFDKDGLRWPIVDFKKANAIAVNEESQKWLYPNGYYCVVRRFSSKEERRRVVANVVDPGQFNGAKQLAFENHLNVFHQGRRGLDEVLARGLAAFLNSKAVDEAFRRFNGHTQVNATDLKLMKYPSRQALCQLGVWVKSLGREAGQPEIDAQLAAALK